MAGRTPDTGQKKTGGYSAVAAALNRELDWPDHRTITRQHVEAWARRGTTNQARQLPPSPLREDPDAAHSMPSRIYRITEWVTWAAAGVPGPRGAKGVSTKAPTSWVVPTRAGAA